jgi:F0F1-type ATP synthase delta subunit
MNPISRRRLAKFATDELLAGKSSGKVAKELAAVLLESKKTKDAELLVQDIALELERRGKLAEASVISATKLNDEIRRELTKFIKQAVGVDQVNLHERVDESVIGGARIETATHTWDQTITKQLTDIREAF